MESKTRLFEVGQKIVCVNSRPAQGVPSKLTEDKIYKVTGYYTCSCGEQALNVGVKETHFKTLTCTCGLTHQYPDERCYSQNRFLPLTEFTKMEEAIFESLKGAKILN